MSLENVISTMPSPSDGDGSSSTFHQYRKNLQQIKQENPHLPNGAIQRMALEQYNDKVKDREKPKGIWPKNALRGMMSKLRIVGKKQEDGLLKSPGEICDFKPAIGSGELDIYPRRKQRSIAVRKSVVASFTSAGVIDGIKSDEEGSLEYSLEKIEKSCTRTLPPLKTLEKRSKLSRDNSMTFHLRMSVLSTDLSDVEEDEEPERTAERVNESSQHPHISPSQGLHVLPVLPDEIKVVLGDFLDDKEKAECDTRDQTNRRARSMRRLQSSFRSKDDVQSSFSSVDSANFAGDFSAWRRMSALSTDLSNVEEDVEPDMPADGVNESSRHNNDASSQVLHVLTVLPDEMKVVLGDLMDDKKIDESESRGQGNNRATSRRILQSPFRSKDDVRSSLSSVDSANFAGDFSAWRSFTSRNS